MLRKQSDSNAKTPYGKLKLMDAITSLLHMILDFLLQLLTLIINFFIGVLRLILNFAYSIVGVVR